MLVIDQACTVRCLYTEELDLSALGAASVVRASHVEPGASGLWRADLAPVGGPVLGPYRWRSAALAAEREWLQEHRLTAKEGP